MVTQFREINNYIDLSTFDTRTINSYNISETLSPIFRDILYYDSIWRPGITFTQKFAEPGQGVIYVNKLTKQVDGPKLPGSDLTDTEVSSDQTSIVINNTFQKSEKVRDVTVSQLSQQTGLTSETFDKVMQEIAEEWQISFTAKVVNTSLNVVDIEPIDDTNVKTKILDVRQLMREAKLRPTFIQASPSVYTAMLAFSGREFTPSTNDEIIATGVVGRFLGMNVFEANVFAEAAAAYIDKNDVTQTIDLTNVDFIMGYADNIAEASSLNNARMKESENFFGVKAQAEVLSGFEVLDMGRTYVRSTVAVVTATSSSFTIEQLKNKKTKTVSTKEIDDKKSKEVTIEDMIALGDDGKKLGKLNKDNLVSLSQHYGVELNENLELETKKIIVEKIVDKLKNAE